MRAWAACMLIGGALALLALAGWRVYQRRRFEAWLRRQLAEVGSW